MKFYVVYEMIYYGGLDTMFFRKMFCFDNISYKKCSFDAEALTEMQANNLFPVLVYRLIS